MTHKTPTSRPHATWRNRARHLPPLALMAILTLWVTCPLWPALSTRLEDLGDPLLNSWILSWDHYALFHQLPDFFQSNVFWPHASTLAYGEHMLTQSVLALPFRLITTHPAALHNLSLIQGYFFTALGAYLLGLYYFQRVAPAAVCALAYGFAAYRVNQGPHLQLIHGEFLPLIILAFERVLAGGGRRWQWALGLAALGQWLTSWYWAVFTFWCVVPYMAVRLWSERKNAECGMWNAELRVIKSAIPQSEQFHTSNLGSEIESGNPQSDVPHSAFRIPHFYRHLAAIALPLLLAAAVAFPVAWPYIRLKQNHYLMRPPEAAASFIARPADFLIPMRRAWLYEHFTLGARLGGIGGERALFPGLFVSLGLLAAMGLALRPKMRNSECGMRNEFNPHSAFQVRRPSEPSRPHSQFPLRLWLVITLTLLSFTFGSWATLHAAGHAFPLPLPLALLRWFPMADQMRVPARWILPALLGLALLSADAWCRLAASPRRGARVLAAAAFVLLLADSLTRPMAFETVPEQRPAALEWLDRQPYPSPILFIPHAYNRVMLEAAWLRQPLANGTNGYFPPAQLPILSDLAAAFPAPQALASLRALGLRFVVINTAEARHPSHGWDPARLPGLLAALPPELRPTPLGDYLILDLGPHETDLARIGLAYNQLERQALLARRGGKPLPR